jgi:tight adherence protein B
MTTRLFAGRHGPNRMVRLTLATLLTVLVLGALAPGAAGQDDGGATSARSGAVVTSVDATASTVEVSLIGAPEVDTGGVSAVVDGSNVEVTGIASSQSVGRPTEVVIVVDTNIRSAQGDTLAVVKEALGSAVAELPAGTSVGFISAGDSALVLQKPTTDRALQLAAVDELSAKNGTALFNAIDRAGTLFSTDPGSVRSLLVISTGVDTASEVGLKESEVGIVQRSVQTVVVAHDGGEPELGDAVARTGGIGLASESSSQLAQAVDQGLDLASDRLLVSFTEPEGTGARAEVSLDVAGEVIGFSYPTGVLTTNPLQLEAQAGDDSGELSFLSSTVGLYVAIGLAFVGISLGVWSLGSIMLGGDSSLEGLLARYTDEGLEPGDEEVDELIVQSAILQRAVNFSESFAEKRGFLARLEDMLERANMPVRAGEAMFMLAAITVLSASFGLVVTRSILASGLLAVFAGGLAFFIVRLLGRRRFKAFESQLPDTLQLLSGTLRAGYSLPQGLDAVSTEVADPMGAELRRAMTEARLGRDLEDSLSAVADRLSSADFAWTVMAIGIQREVGGNLNELLMSVADTMIARERLKREIGALTAEGRMSAGVLSFLPPGLGTIMWILNPGYISLLFTEVMGNVLLGMGVVSALIGLAWMKKVITVDV